MKLTWSQSSNLCLHTFDRVPDWDGIGAVKVLTASPLDELSTVTALLCSTSFCLFCSACVCNSFLLLVSRFCGVMRCQDCCFRRCGSSAMSLDRYLFQRSPIVYWFLFFLESKIIGNRGGGRKTREGVEPNASAIPNQSMEWIKISHPGVCVSFSFISCPFF